MSSRAKYEEYFRQRALNDFNSKGEGVQDFSGDLAPGVGREKIDAAVKAGAVDKQNNAIPAEATNAGAYGGAAQSAVQTMNQGGSPAATIGSGMTTAGALMMAGSKPSPASPYLLGAGLGLQVLAQGEQNRRQQQEAQRQAYNDRIKARQEAMARIASMGIQ
jgi:hypothetical protein